MSFRALPPAGGLRKLTSEFDSSIFLTALKGRFNAGKISFCGSGTAALSIVCSELKKRGAKRVVVSGYNCPDVVVGIIRGGLEVFAVDIDERTLEMNLNTVDSEQDIVLLSNLYGLADDSKNLADEQIIDDACQGALSTAVGRVVGSRGLGVLSFGRGKAIGGVGGGAVLGIELGSEIKKRPIDLLKYYLMLFLERPALFPIPASLPFLHLGETKYEPNKELSPVSEQQLRVAYSQLIEIEDEIKLREKNQRAWIQAFSGTYLTLPLVERNNKNLNSQSVLIRFPIVFPSKALRDKAFQELVSEGLGASISYPADLTEICAGESRLRSTSLEVAKDISRRIMTLPTHKYVRQEDIERVMKILC